MAEKNYIYFYPGHQKIYFDDITDIDTVENDITELAARWLNGEEYFEFKTSGSTGTAKNIILTREQIIASINHTASVIDYIPNQNCLLCLSPLQIGGAMVLLRALHLGLNVYICLPQVASILYFLNQDYDIHHASFVSLQMEKIIAAGFRNRLESINYIFVGGGAIGKKLEEVLYTFTNKVYQTYGMTETCSNIALRRLSRGNTGEYYTVFNGIDIETDERDCLKIKGDISNNIWLQSNDIVELKSNNLLKFLGRADFIINSGGIKINPELVEQKLAEQLPNRNYIISSKPDDTLGEKLVLIIEGEEKINIDFESFAPFEKPKEVLYIIEFPRTDSGKVDRMKLRNI
ncbi:MAG: AMP-binding protein [Bacteroidota bacterium]|nr:AMP-binding protein [Bacteroidota bacterium]